ncbi:MAG: hypothetical protein HLUCCA12_10480 [Rhodobacteraceae bacterium HLUCCA12]|nr:MAG: hypothetical protein HLUCCA12_10480 [Rhodobacteraceae bacterium HLUCCA12]
MPRERILPMTLAALAAPACVMGLPAAGQGLPEGFAPAEYVPQNPAPQLPPGTDRDDILWRDGCYYILQDGAPVLLPFTETNATTGEVSQYDRYCIG